MMYIFTHMSTVPHVGYICNMSNTYARAHAHTRKTSLIISESSQMMDVQRWCHGSGYKRAWRIKSSEVANLQQDYMSRKNLGRRLKTIKTCISHSSFHLRCVLFMTLFKHTWI